MTNTNLTPSWMSKSGFSRNVKNLGTKVYGLKKRNDGKMITFKIIIKYDRIRSGIQWFISISIIDFFNEESENGKH